MPLPEKVPLLPLPTVILLSEKPVTASENVKVKVTEPSAMLTVPASLSVIVNVGAVISSVWALLPVVLPVFPARSVILKIILLLPDNVAPLQLIAVPFSGTVDVISVQVIPPSTEPQRVSPVDNGADNVALIVWAAVLVIKSVRLVPVSALRLTPLTVRVGAFVSMVWVYWSGVVAWLPAASVTPLVLTSMVMSPSVNVVGVTTRV